MTPFTKTSSKSPKNWITFWACQKHTTIGTHPKQIIFKLCILFSNINDLNCLFYFLYLKFNLDISFDNTNQYNWSKGNDSNKQQ